MEMMEILNTSGFSNTSSLFITISNEAVVDPAGKVTLYGPEL